MSIPGDKKKQTKDGVFLIGIVLKEWVFNRDSLYGGPLSIEAPKEERVPSNTRKKLSETRVAEVLYDQYFSLLKATKKKKFLNKEIKRKRLNKQEIIQIYLKETKISKPSKVYLDRLDKVIDRNLMKLEAHGGIPYRYKHMGTSPRILPVRYGNTINNTKRIVRNKVYEQMASVLTDSVIIDYDLKSCYTSILLGLYPSPLEEIQKAIETKGLWAHVEDEFKQNEVHHHWNKPAVKICVYSSFFLGGNKAMMNGILESFRNDIGISQSEFRDLDVYEGLYEQASQVVKVMQNSSIITDFRDVAQQIKEENMNDYLIGPTGHKYLVNDHTFISAYPNYLQSYEFFLLSSTTLSLLSKFKQCEVIGHYHDGNTLLVPRDLQEEVNIFFIKEVERFGNELGLQYKQGLEIKKVYG